MKIKINHYLLKIIRENLSYLVALAMLIVISIASIIVFFLKYSDFSTKTTQAEQEIVSLRKKADLVLYKNQIISQGYNIEEINKIFSQLLPNEEDYFSALLALEKLSSKTNFIITAYIINLQASTIDKLTVTIEGEGDQDSFFNFLQNYQFGGNRLITIDKIDFNTTGVKSIKLSLNFYSGKPSMNQTDTDLLILTDKDRQLIDRVKAKTQIELKEEEEDINYPIKSNPF